MRSLKIALAPFCIRGDDPTLNRRQLIAVAKQMPVLYIVLCTNTILLALIERNGGPFFLSNLMPLLAIPPAVFRGYKWMRWKGPPVEDTDVLRLLRKTLRTVQISSLAFSVWNLGVLMFSDGTAQVQGAFVGCLTVISCMLSLMHLQAAAFSVALIFTLPHTIAFLLIDNPLIRDFALPFVMVTIGIALIISINGRDFEDLVHSEQHVAMLGRDNYRLANQDSLTGLANRRHFFASLAGMTKDGVGTARGVTLGLIDLDGFKPVNDLYGHGAGDRVLIEVSRRLEATLEGIAECARLGGDEFGLILTLAADSAVIDALGAAICRAIEAPIWLSNGSVRVAASIGFAACPDRSGSLDQLIEQADYALYYAKEHQRGTAVMFTKAHENAIRARSSIDQELRQADLEAELSLQFQPLIDLDDGRVISFEALARWDSPVLGRVHPIDFITAAERIGLITTLTDVLFRKASAAALFWPDTVYLSFNLSVHDIATPSATARIIAILAESGMPAPRVMFEITETAIMRDFDQARDALLMLKATGARIALDDFGTGYSSLSNVHRLPLDKIKIDRSFVTALEDNKATQDIVKSILDLCRNLQIGCIVEGAETTEQVSILRQLGCTTIQGYYFSKPIGPEAIDDFLHVRRPIAEMSALAGMRTAFPDQALKIAS